MKTEKKKYTAKHYKHLKARKEKSWLKRDRIIKRYSILLRISPNNRFDSSLYME